MIIHLSIFLGISICQVILAIVYYEPYLASPFLPTILIIEGTIGVIFSIIALILIHRFNQWKCFLTYFLFIYLIHDHQHHCTPVFYWTSPFLIIFSYSLIILTCVRIIRIKPRDRQKKKKNPDNRYTHFFLLHSILRSDMTCNEDNCINLTCALCYHCQQSLCLQHIIHHHDLLVERHLSFYEVLQELYRKLHSMSIERCYHQVFEQLSSNENSSGDALIHLRSIREELIEQLNRFKQKQFLQLQKISLRLQETKQMVANDEANDLKMKLEDIQTSINSLVYGIHLELSKTNQQIQCRKIFHHQIQPTETEQTDSVVQKSASWTNGSTENYWTEKNELDDHLSLF